MCKFYKISPKSISRWKLRSYWLPNTNEIDKNSMEFTWPMQTQPLRTQRELCSVGLHWVRQASRWVGKAFRWGRKALRWVCKALHWLFGYQHVGIINAKVLCWGYCQTRIPNMSGFVLHWNIGFKPLFCDHTSDKYLVNAYLGN